MSHSLFYRQDAPQGTNLQVPCPCPLVCSAASRRQPAFGSVLRAGPRGSRHLSDEPEPHCSLRRPCPPAPPLPVPLRALPVKATARTGAPIQLTHPSGAGVNRNGGLTHRASREPTRSSPALTTHPTWSSSAGLRQGPTQARGLAHSVAEKREMIQHTSKELRGERP